MPKIVVRADTIETAIADVDRVRAELDSQLTTLDADMDQVFQDWNSESGQAFADRFGRWRAEMSAAMDRLDRLREALASGQESYAALQESVRSL